MVEITIRCNRREKNGHNSIEPNAGSYEWKVGELRFSVDEKEFSQKPKAYIVECYFCGDKFGLVLGSKIGNGHKSDNIAFPITKIEPKFKSPVWGHSYTHTVWSVIGKHIIGKVARWDNNEIYEYNGKKVFNSYLRLLDNREIKRQLVNGWKENYFINKANRKLAIWYLKMNPGCSSLDLFEFFKLNEITNDLTWVEILITDLIELKWVKINKSRLFMNYLSGPDDTELLLTEKGEVVLEAS